MSSPSLTMASPYPPAFWLIFQRIGPLGAIILLHIGFFYVLQNGLLRQAAQVVLPKTVMVNFITSEQPKPKPAPPQPVPTKTIPVVKKTTTLPPVTPKIHQTPSDKAITTPATPPVPPEPVAEAAPPATPVPPVPASPAQPKNISSGIEYIEPPQPAYPAAARRMGEEGRVMLRVLVNEKGRPEHVEVHKTSGSPRLDEAARHAVMRAVFKPHIEDGRAIAVFAIIPIRFQLDS
ncbi:MAG TPA: TonB family protein [Noviherbaspirillum sp.]|nr:TonB family protein [Noviherbaspirillum sp.]